MRLWLNPAFNRLVFRLHGITFGRKMLVQNKIYMMDHGIITIGAHSFIGADSVVTHGIPADVIAAGNPCKVIRKIELSN